MKRTACLLILLTGFRLAQAAAPAGVSSPAASSAERLGTVSFPVSCAESSQAPFNRGVALLHDFWYEEARHQFQRIIDSDPGCAMAHWGVAMSVFHEIWDRPDASAMDAGWKEMEKAQSLPANTDRERGYIAALAQFYRPGGEDYPTRIKAYSTEMGKLYAHYPEDVDAGAFYALSMLAAEEPDDTSLAQEHKAMAVLGPLFAKYPDNPGVVHYTIHACDNPAMAADGLTAANHYGEIAQSGPHAFHMPGHIYARLGMWPQDIASQLGSIEASRAAEAKGESGIMDEPHSYDFLLYAYLQSGEDDNAKQALKESSEPLTMVPDRGGDQCREPRPASSTSYWKRQRQLISAYFTEAALQEDPRSAMSSRCSGSVRRARCSPATWWPRAPASAASTPRCPRPRASPKPAATRKPPPARTSCSASTARKRRSPRWPARWTRCVREPSGPT